MKLDEIDELSGAAFSEAEISLAKNIFYDQDYLQSKALLATLTIFLDDGETPVEDAKQAQRKVFRSQLFVWYNKFKDGTIAIKGGKKGTDYSNKRDKEDLRGEIRKMVGLPEIPPERLNQENPKIYSSTSTSYRSY